MDPRTGLRAPIHPLTGQRPLPQFNDIMRGEGAGGFFKKEEEEALRIFYGRGEGGTVPLELLGELRDKIDKRRDKLSRAVMGGGELSESVPEQDDQMLEMPVPIPLAQQARRPRRGYSRQREAEAGGKHPSAMAPEGHRAGGEANRGSVRDKGGGFGVESAASTASRGAEAVVGVQDKAQIALTKRLRRDLDATQPARAGKTTSKAPKRDLLRYNPSVVALMENQAAGGEANTENVDAYLGWAQVKLTSGGGAEALKCEVKEHRGGIVAVSPAGVLLGEVSSLPFTSVPPLGCSILLTRADIC